ncbi:hypothetical protein [Sanguibacter gelidistatuariae]|nr:hypothetical protein [Sanguibacter gelidistatuariae]
MSPEDSSTVPDDAVPDDARERFRELPEPVRVEDTIATHPAAPVPDPTLGDPDTDWLLRNAG